MSELTFPRQYARTQRLTLGEPRNVTVSPDGRRVVFCRSAAGDDPMNCLWVLDVMTGEERLVADPRRLLTQPDGDDDASDDDASDDAIPAEERARRERTREGAGGIVSYSTDAAAAVVAFALAGRLFVAGLLSGAARELAVQGPVFDPRPDPMAKRVAYVSGPTLRIGELDASSWELDAVAGSPTVTCGSAEFIAAEEMGRQRGYWWSPDGMAIAVERADVAPVPVWHIADPAHPEVEPTEHRYPAAGTQNAEVSLHVSSLSGGTVKIEWDSDSFPYLAAVSWPTQDRLLVTVQSRDQTDLLVLSANPITGESTVIFEDHDDQWVELVPGVPGVLADGQLVVAAERGGARRLLIGDRIMSPSELQVRSVIDIGGDTVTFIANPLDDPTVQHVWVGTIKRQSSGDPEAQAGAGAGAEMVEWAQITSLPGVHSASVGGPTRVIRSATLATFGTATTVQSSIVQSSTLGNPEDESRVEQTIASNAQVPLVEPNVSIHRVGDDELAVAVLLPNVPFDGPLPVLLDPYGGPHSQRVVSARSAYLSSQWFADQGFAVIVIDGRGTPGRGTEWERAVHHDLATPVLDDQIRALDAITDKLALDGVHLDRSRVGIRGWSFGGYLAALAVLSRPDLFHAAVAGAPVTEWRLYDTHYTERYLGDPFTDSAPYDRSSLLPLAARLTRPLLLIHGLADDNVVAGHTLRLSSALLEAGKAHEVLPLCGVTHMTPQEIVAENLLLHQLEFLRRSLRIEQ